MVDKKENLQKARLLYLLYTYYNIYIMKIQQFFFNKKSKKKERNEIYVRTDVFLNVHKKHLYKFFDL